MRTTILASIVAMLGLTGCITIGDRGAPYLSPDYAGRSTAYYGGYRYGGWDRDRSSSDRFKPRPGVVCDRSQRVCYDRTGADVGLTREYFGRDSARWVERRTDERERYYSPRKKVRCDLKDEVCLRKGDPDWQSTRKQFGRRAANDVRDPDFPQGRIVPNKKVSCDVGDEVCFKKGRPNVDRTRYVFGDRAAKELKRDLKPDRKKDKKKRNDD